MHDVTVTGCGFSFMAIVDFLVRLRCAFDSVILSIKSIEVMPSKTR